MIQQKSCLSSHATVRGLHYLGQKKVYLPGRLSSSSEELSVSLEMLPFESSHGAGVALLKPKKGIPCRLSSSREELPVSL